jgi:hypothetical protein
MSWKNFAAGTPELAEFGEQRFASEVAYLATIRKDGSPRVHPVTPIIGDSHLFVFMEPTSPKGWDLKRDGRYAMHASVEDSGGGGGEFSISGTARLVTDMDTRALAVKSASYQPTDRYILFELSVLAAFATIYAENGEPVRCRWKQTE